MYAILRMQKIKNNSQLASAVAHNLRTIPVANADTRIENRKFEGLSYAEVVGKLETRLLETGNSNHRKDAVRAVEFVLTASPDFFIGKSKDDIDDWLAENYNFLKQELGLENILQVVLHNDESTPHLHVIATPITKNNRLSCKDLFGGKAKLSALQSRYATTMEKFGLKRGEVKEKTERKTIKEYYSLINRLAKLNPLQLKKIANIIDDENADQNTYKLMKELNYQLAQKPPKNASKRNK